MGICGFEGYYYQRKILSKIWINDDFGVKIQILRTDLKKTIWETMAKNTQEEKVDFFLPFLEELLFCYCFFSYWKIARNFALYWLYFKYTLTLLANKLFWKVGLCICSSTFSSAKKHLHWPRFLYVIFQDLSQFDCKSFLS